MRYFTGVHRERIFLNWVTELGDWLIAWLIDWLINTPLVSAGIRLFSLIVSRFIPGSNTVQSTWNASSQFPDVMSDWCINCWNYLTKTLTLGKREKSPSSSTFAFHRKMNFFWHFRFSSLFYCDLRFIPLGKSALFGVKKLDISSKKRTTNLRSPFIPLDDVIGHTSRSSIYLLTIYDSKKIPFQSQFIHRCL